MAGAVKRDRFGRYRSEHPRFHCVMSDKRKRIEAARIREFLGHGPRVVPKPDLLVPGALFKCECGATMKTALDYRLHTSGKGVCLYSDASPRRSPMFDALFRADKEES